MTCLINSLKLAIQLLLKVFIVSVTLQSAGRNGDHIASSVSECLGHNAEQRLSANSTRSFEVAVDLDDSRKVFLNGKPF